MSVARTPLCRIEYRWCFHAMIPWYRQLLALLYGVGVVMIALWALEQGQGPYVILGVVGMSLLTLLLIFGVEINEITVGDKIQIDFTDTSNTGRDKDDDE